MNFQVPHKADKFLIPELLLDSYRTLAPRNVINIRFVDSLSTRTASTSFTKGA